MGSTNDDTYRSHRGPGIDIPAQGLHLRHGDDGHRYRGVLDTSMGPIAVDMLRADAAPAHAEPPLELLIAVPEQFVALSIEGEDMTGTIETGAGSVPFAGRRHGA